MPENKKLNLTIIGCGAIFENNHFRALKNSEQWNIIQTIDKDTKQAKKYADIIGCQFNNDISNILPETDACLVATPNFLHATQSIYLLNKGFNVICEKPLALNHKEAQEIWNAFEKNQKQFFMVHQMRFLETVTFLKEILSNIPIDNILNIDISYGNKFEWQSRTNFYQNPQSSGGGVIIDLGVHLFDLLISFWSEIQVHDCYLFAENDQFPLMDTAVTCYGKIVEKIPFSLRTSRINQLNNSLRIKTINIEYEISLSDSRFKIIHLNNNEVVDSKTIILPETDPFETLWTNIYRSINKTSVNYPPSTIEEGMKVIELLESIWKKGKLCN